MVMFRGTDHPSLAQAPRLFNAGADRAFCRAPHRRYARGMTIELNTLVAEDFDALVGSAVPAHVAGRDLSLVLEQVWRSPYPTGRDQPGFSLFLRGNATLPLGQGMLRLQHPVHGALDLFATPVGREGDMLRYEIVFN